MRCFIKKNSQGQSLIEVVVAMAVIAVGLFALSKVSAVALRNANFARNRALATKYAQLTMESIRESRDQKDWAAFVSTCQHPSGIPSPLPTPLIAPSVTCKGGSGDCRTADTSCDITVTVSWTDPQGTHNSKIETHLTSWNK